ADIKINAALQAQNGILLVAGTDITSSSGALTTNGTNVASGNITIVAGAKYIETAGVVTITGESATGGKIDFKTGGLTALDASNSSVILGATGGNITLAAYT